MPSGELAVDEVAPTGELVRPHVPPRRVSSSSGADRAAGRASWSFAASRATRQASSPPAAAPGHASFAVRAPSSAAPTSAWPQPAEELAEQSGGAPRSGRRCWEGQEPALAAGKLGVGRVGGRVVLIESRGMAGERPKSLSRRTSALKHFRMCFQP